MKRAFSGVFVLVLLVSALVLRASIAQADEGLFYLGAGVTSNKLNDIQVQGTAFPDLNKTSWKVFAGFRPISAFAVEADYLDLGSATVEGACITDCCYGGCRGLFQSDAQVFAAYALGFLPIPVPFLDVYGKAGLAHSTLNTTSLQATTSHDTGFAWGVGVQAHISMFGARLEYEQFNVPNTSGAKVASLSVFLNF